MNGPQGEQGQPTGTLSIGKLFPGDGYLAKSVARLLRHFALLMQTNRGFLKQRIGKGAEDWLKRSFVWGDRGFVETEFQCAAKEQAPERISQFLDTMGSQEQADRLLRHRAEISLKSLVQYLPDGASSGKALADQNDKIELEGIGGFLLLAGAKKLRGGVPGALELLAFLSKYRLLSDDRTMWTPPSADDGAADTSP